MSERAYLQRGYRASEISEEKIKRKHPIASCGH